jgi:ferredoxin/flavodoxin---NADP+ reductase
MLVESKMDQIKWHSRALRIAIIGSGPSGFLTAEALLNMEFSLQVDLFERLPAPFGLVRYGVAPDHPSPKRVIDKFNKIAAGDGYAFYGNVDVGRDVSVEELRRHYDVLVFACGAPLPRKLGIPGENLAGCHSAIEFVSWFNGHPDFRDASFDLTHQTAVIIGQGNVALDVARILARNPQELQHTDIARHALDVLMQSNVRDIYLVGRRGPCQVSFTSKELKEISELNDAHLEINPSDLVLNASSQTELDETQNRQLQRIFALFQDVARRNNAATRKRIILRFLRSPLEIVGNSKVEKLILEKNTLTGSPGRQRSCGTGEAEEVSCGLIFLSVGYYGERISGIPFDEKRGVFSHLDGRISQGEKLIPGLYAVGWIKHGPSGVIGTNKIDSKSLVESLRNDLPHLTPCPSPDSRAVLRLLENRKIKVVSVEDWSKIDSEEVARGLAAGKPREKFCSAEEMLDCL